LLEMVEKEATARTNSQNSASANSSPAGGNNVATMPNGAVGPVWQGMPAEVEAIWKRIVDRKSLCAVFAELHHDLVEVAGSRRGEALYNSILASRGVQRPEQFPNLGPARQTASALWKAIQDVANEAAVS
jgi:hypothetical protein